MPTPLSDPYDRYFAPGITGPLGHSHRPLQGVRVSLKKGTLIHSLHPRDTNDWFPLKRASVITIFGAAQGYFADVYHHPEENRYHHAELTWPGSGGYWRHVKLRDVAILDEIRDDEGRLVPVVTPVERAQFETYLVTLTPASKTL